MVNPNTKQSIYENAFSLKSSDLVIDKKLIYIK